MNPPRSQRMRPADAAWVGLDRPHNRLVVTGVLRLSGDLDLDDLRERVRTRMVRTHPRLTEVARRRHPLLPPRWHADPTFDVRRHVVAASADRLDDDALSRLAGELVSTPLDAGRPPWQLHLVRRTGGGSALVARFHHSLADGAALATVLLGLTDGSADGPRTRAVAGRRTGRRPVDGLRAVAAVVPTVGRLLLTLGEPATALRGPLGPAKELALTEPHDLEEVRRVADAHGVSINDVLLAATAGGLRTHLLRRGGPASDLRVVVPVDLRADVPVPAHLGNRFGIVFVRLPVGEPDRLRRLRAVSARTARLTASAEAGSTYVVLQLVGVLPRPVRRLAAGLLGNSASAVVTNVPGPRERLTIGSCVVDDVVFWVPTVGRVGLGISLFSYAGTLTVGVAADERLDLDPAGLAAAIQDEIAALGR